MDSQEALQEKQPEQIKEEIELTRSALGYKLEALESEVKGSIDSVQNSIEIIVSDIKRQFDIRDQIKRHPLIAVGVGLAAGALAGTAISSPSVRSIVPAERHFEPSSSVNAQVTPEHVGMFEDEIKQVKSLAIGVLFGSLRDMIKESVPKELAPRVSGIVNNVARKFGGEVV